MGIGDLGLVSGHCPIGLFKIFYFLFFFTDFIGLTLVNKIT